jgi:hypothetical protein
MGDELQGMDKIHNICADTLNARMTEARELIDSAAECLFRHDYTQAAVRLEGLKRLGTFSPLEFSIFDAASGDASREGHLSV